MANVAETYTPNTAQELKEALEKCLKERKVPVFLSRKNVNEKSLIDDEKLKDIDVALIDVENLKKKEDMDVSPTQTESVDLTPLEDKMDKLQKLVGATPVFRIEAFQNWAATKKSLVISCNPKTKEEISSVIKAAAKEKVGVRCAGQRHSWAPVFPDDNQVCINVEDMKSDYAYGSKIRFADKEKREVDVLTGVTTGDLKKFQLKNKVNLNTNVIIDAVQMVSAVVTGCHGVGKNSRCLSDYVVRMRIIDSEGGEPRTYRLTDDTRLFRAMSAGFGCFGVVYDVTLKMEKEMIVETGNSYETLDKVFTAEKLKSIVEENWAVQIFWFPFNSFSFGKYDVNEDDVWVRTFNEKDPEGEDLKDKLYYIKKAVSDYRTEEALRIVSPYLTKWPELVPIFQKSSFSAIKHLFYPEGKIFQELPNAVHFRKYVDKAEVYDLEFVFDYKGDFDKVLDIINDVVDSVQNYYDKNQFPLNVTLEMRFMTCSDAYLGTGVIGNPDYGGSGHVVCIEILSLKGTTDWPEFSKVVGEKWMNNKDIQGVPNLAKQYDHIPGIFDDIKHKMECQIDSFKTQLNKSGADPSGMFLNQGMRNLLGLDKSNNQDCDP